MKVLLKKDVDTLGYAGEVYTVADGYGRNYLIPQGLAVKATPNELKKAEAWRKQAEIRREELRAEHEKLSERIEDVVLTFEARAGETGKLYGSITTSQIADELNEKLGTDIDRRKVGTEPIRQLGEHKVAVRLSAEHQPELTVIVNPEGTTYEEFFEDRGVVEAEMIITETIVDGEVVEEVAVFEVDGEVVQEIELTEPETVTPEPVETDEETAA